MTQRIKRGVGTLAVLGMTLLAATGQAAPALPGDIIADLEAQAARLAEGEGAAVAAHGRAQAARLAGGNAADRWARALYLQLAANAEARAGRHGPAAELLSQARASQAVDAARRDRWLREEAGLRLAAGETARGVALLEEWLSRREGGAQEHWQMAAALASLERWSSAARWVERALADASPDDAQRALAVSVLQRAGQTDQALALLSDGLDADSPAEAWRRAAGLAQRVGQAGQAAALWEAGWRLGALSGTEARLTLIRLHLAGGTPARAAEHLVAALEAAELPDTLAHRRLLAQAWEQARDRPRALAAWQAVARRSVRAEDWQRLGQLAHSWGEDALAGRALSRAQGLAEGADRSLGAELAQR